jgi:hypothetical protein
VVRTDCDRFYGQADYPEHGPGVTAEATRASAISPPLPAHGFEVACFPLRIIGGSAAPGPRGGDRPVTVQLRNASNLGLADGTGIDDRAPFLAAPTSGPIGGSARDGSLHRWQRVAWVLPEVRR